MLPALVEWRQLTAGKIQAISTVLSRKRRRSRACKISVLHCELEKIEPRLLQLAGFFGRQGFASERRRPGSGISAARHTRHSASPGQWQRCGDFVYASGRAHPSYMYVIVRGPSAYSVRSSVRSKPAERMRSSIFRSR